MTRPRSQEQAPAGSSQSPEKRSWRGLSIWVPILLAALVAGLQMRLDGIRSSLWLDEFGTLWTIDGTLRMAFERAISVQGQTPFYYSLVWGWLQLFGESEVAIRACSLLFGVATWAAIALGAREAFGPAAGRFAFIVAAFDPFLIGISANARPYSLAMLCVTLATVGFILAVKRGRGMGRFLWVVGGAGTAWAHYLLFPIVLGLHTAYLILPDLRRRYRVSSYIKDLLAQAILVAVTVPQLLYLLSRQHTLDWIEAPQHLAPFTLALPYLVPLAMGEWARREEDRTDRAVRLALWISVGFNVLLLEALNFFGINLLFWRYLVGLLVPILLLSANALGRLRPVPLTLSALWTAGIVVLLLSGRKMETGSFTGLGEQDWRGAVSALTAELGSNEETPVFFRSGFVEEDLLPLGSPPAFTRSPLRSPGRNESDLDLVPLTYRWDLPEREAYYRDVIEPTLEGVGEFYLLSKCGSYTSAFEEWVESTWPGAFEQVERVFGNICLVHFLRNVHANEPRGQEDE